jgi:hypothetical protein
MSLPPPSDPYGSQPPSGGGQPGGGVPSWGGQPPGYGGQYGQPPQGQTGGPPPWGPQPQWAGPPGPPPGRGGRGKWILGGLAVLLAIALAVVITVLVVRPSGGGVTPTPQNGHSDFASAGDDGAVAIITDDPTCAAWSKAGTALFDAEQQVKWTQRDPSVPATGWTPQQRTTFETVGNAMTHAADQTVGLAKTTPHRVMRELYEQFIAYARAFSERVPNYTERDNEIARVADGFASVFANICGAIKYSSAAAQAPLLSPADSPSRVASPENVEDPQRFLERPDPDCAEWTRLLDRYFDDTTDWQAISQDIPATQWTPEQRAINDKVVPVMTTFADDLEKLARRSENPAIQDFGVLAAEYERAYAQALPTYTAADSYLVAAATFLAKTIEQACKAAG